MSEDAGLAPDGPPEAASRNPLPPRLLVVVGGVAAGLLLLVSVVSMVLLVGLLGQTTALEEQGRRLVKANKALQEDVAALKDALRPHAAAPHEAPKTAPADPRPGNIDAADPQRDCVVRAGDKGAVANCMGIDLKKPAK